MTVARIATSRNPIPVTVGTFERLGLGGGGDHTTGGELGGVRIPSTGNIYSLVPF